MAAKSAMSLPVSASWTCRRCQMRSPRAVAKAFSQPSRAKPFSVWTARAEELQVQPAPEIDLSALAKQPARIIPASPSYYTASPIFNDYILTLQRYMQQYQSLPTVSPEQAPKIVFKTLAQFRTSAGEKVAAAKYSKMLVLLRRLNLIHPKLRPREVTDILELFRRPGSADIIPPQPGRIDRFGRSRGVGRRKSSTARVSIVEGTGEILINGRNIVQTFPRLHDRESALWPLKVTDRLDKYNVFVVAEGGGLTGQAEAITLGLAKALLVQEPALKPALRKAGCVTRIMKRVERKKTGRVKARKRPTWVKR